MRKYVVPRRIYLDGDGWEATLFQKRNGYWVWEVDVDFGDWGFSQTYEGGTSTPEAAKRSLLAFLFVTIGDASLLV